MTRRFFAVYVFFGLSTVGAACDLNPQPLPPQGYGSAAGEDAGAVVSPGGSSSSSGGMGLGGSSGSGGANGGSSGGSTTVNIGFDAAAESAPSESADCGVCEGSTNDAGAGDAEGTGDGPTGDATADQDGDAAPHDAAEDGSHADATWPSWPSWDARPEN